MKRHLKIVMICFLGILVGVAATYGAIHITTQYLNHQYASLHDGCMPNQAQHTVVIQNDKAVPNDIVAARCDTLTITNLDEEERLMAFGVHEAHVSYDGISEQSLTHGQSFTVTLVQTGSFKVHDHEHDEVKATFEVK